MASSTVFSPTADPLPRVANISTITSDVEIKRRLMYRTRDRHWVHLRLRCTGVWLSQKGVRDAALWRDVPEPDCLLEQSGFELPSLLIAALLWWSAEVSLLRRFQHERGLAKSSLREEYRRIMVCSNLPPHHRRAADVTGFGETRPVIFPHRTDSHAESVEHGCGQGRASKHLLQRFRFSNQRAR
jgi:hypothetical protein